MDGLNNDRRVDSIEFNVVDLARSREFYGTIFSWTFKDYGQYLEFDDGRLRGGFTTAGKPNPGGPLAIIYADNLEEIKRRVIAAGATITVQNLEFPGGRRFHFVDLDGYELAVWSEK